MWSTRKVITIELTYRGVEYIIAVISYSINRYVLQEGLTFTGSPKTSIFAATSVPSPLPEAPKVCSSGKLYNRDILIQFGNIAYRMRPNH